VPEEAIVRFAGVTKLFTVADGRATAVPVEVGVRFDVAPGGTEHDIEIPAEAEFKPTVPVREI
jgi:hypothetical protein